MKNHFLVAVCIVIAASCSKQQETTYEPIVPADVNDQNFRLSSFSVQKSGGQISVTFVTSVQKDIVQIELMHGSNPNQLCRVRALETAGMADSVQTYNIVDESPMGSPTYYIIKYTLKNGEWGCSEVYNSGL